MMPSSNGRHNVSVQTISRHAHTPATFRNDAPRMPRVNYLFFHTHNLSVYIRLERRLGPLPIDAGHIPNLKFLLARLFLSVF